MAKLILDEHYPSKVSPFYNWWRIVIVGAGMGAIYWALTILINSFLIEPIFCGSSLNAQICTNSLETSGNLALVLTMVIGLIVMIRIAAPRPLIVTAATAGVLWGLAGWTNGLNWAEVASWSVVLFSLSYLLFAWISRYAKSMVVIAVSIAIVLVVRILAIL